LLEIKAGKGRERSLSTKALIGAGTGLGKSILIYDKHFKIYVPIPSEGGHGDFPIQNDFEIKLTKFIKEFRGISQPITYEELLSGRGYSNSTLQFILKKSMDHKTKQNLFQNIEKKMKHAERLLGYLHGFMLAVQKILF